MSKSVLILGASGKIGRHSAEAFEVAGWSVRKFNRQKEDMTATAQGCDVIVNGLNPPNYRNWAVTIPKITNDVIRAAKLNGATVLVPGNVYHFGDTPGVWSESSPTAPVSRKGRIRFEMERTYEKSGVQTIVLRAGNFIDPNRQGCPMSSIHLRDIKRGRITLPGPAETRQAMCFLPDWARAAVALAEMRNTLSRFEDVPFEGHTLTAQQIKAGVEAILDRDTKFVPFPWWLMRMAAPVWELARELNEMRYLWSTDHSLSGTRLRQLLPDFESTPLDTVLRHSVPPEVLNA